MSRKRKTESVHLLDRYEIRTVGSSVHQEYWIPAEDLPEFNRNIVGKTEVVAEFLGD
jgi:hypothetical protein